RTWRTSTLAFLQSPVTDVPSELHAVEADRVGRLVGAGARHLERAAERRDAKYPPATGDEALAIEGGSRVEHVAILGRLGQHRDFIPFARFFRVTAGGEHHAQRRTAIPVGRRAIQGASERVLDQSEQV